MYKNKCYLVIICLILILALKNPIPSQAQEKADTYGHAIEKIDSLIKDEMDKNNIPGLSVAVVNEGGIIWSKGYGYQDVEEKIKATPETLYRVGSISKSLTAVAILLLEQRGLIDLDAPINEYIPDFKIKSRFDKIPPITVRQLLSHHSGLKRDHYKDIIGHNPPHLDFVIEELADDYLALPPDTSYKYSNLNYALLGKIIENVTNKSYSQYMREELLEPLGMDNSYPELTSHNISQIAESYQIKGWLWKRPKRIEQLKQRDKPAGSIISSVKNMSNFLQFVLNNGVTADSEQLLDADLIDEMLTVQYPDRELDEDPYGLGWKVNMDSIPYTKSNIRHGGTLPGFSSLIAALPEEKLGIVVCYNTNNVFARHYIASQALKELAIAKKNIKINIDYEVEVEEPIVNYYPDQKGFTGRFVGMGDIPLVLDLYQEKDELKLDLQGETLTLIPTEDDKRYKVVKKLLFLKLGVGRFLGVDDVFLDYYQARDGQIYPRLILGYENLEMKIYANKIIPYQLPQYAQELAGEYTLSDMDGQEGSMDTYSNLRIRIEDDWILMKTQILGNDINLLLKPVGPDQLVTYGTGETVFVKGDKIKYSGLIFERVE